MAFTATGCLSPTATSRPRFRGAHTFKGFCTDVRARYDGDIWSQDSKVRYPGVVCGCRKTRLALCVGEGRWRVIEGRCDMDHFVCFSAQDARDTGKTISFVQPPRVTFEGMSWRISRRAGDS